MKVGSSTEYLLQLKYHANMIDMANFLSSYWWILLIALLIISVVLKKTTKLLLFIVVSSIFCFLFWQLFIAKDFAQSSACFIVEAEASEEFYEQVSQLPEGEMRNQLVCEESFTSYKRLEKCFVQSAQKNKLAFTIFSALPSFKKVMRETLEEHNRRCPNFLLSYPSFK